MAQYRFSMQAIKSSEGRSLHAAAAYRAASRIIEVISDKETGISFERIHDYTHKQGVVASGIIVPVGAPEWTNDRQRVYDKTLEAKRQKNEQLAQEIQISIPVEMNQAQAKRLVEEFLRQHYAANGIICDYSVHWDNPKNPHVHVLLSTREIEAEGFGKKNRDWHRKEHLKESRKVWCEHVNKHLALCGIDARVDHRSYKEQGIELEATIHEGVAAREIRGRGEESDRVEINWEIKRKNLRKVIEQPEILLKKLSIEKPMFTEADIAREAFIMTDGVDAYYGKLQAAVKNSDSLVKLDELNPEGKTLYAHRSFTQSKEQMEKEAALLAERKSFEIETLDKQLSIMRSEIEIPDHVAAKVKEMIEGADVVAVMASEDPLATRTVIRTAAEVYRAGGYRVSQIALTAIDAHALAVATELGSVAIEDWLHRGDEAEITDQDVFILHEASRVDVDAMGRVAAHVRAKGAKLICLGDAAHIAAFNSSAAFRSVDQITQTVALEKEYLAERKAPINVVQPLSIIEKLSLRNATFTEADIAKEVFTVTEGDDTAYQQLLRSVMQHKELVTLDRVDLKDKVRYTSSSYLSSEQNLFAVTSALHRRNSSSVVARDSDVVLRPMLEENTITGEQAEAVEHIVSGPDITAIIGKAGTGKTTKVIAPAATILKEAGYRVTGIALAGIAAQGIAKEAGVEACTIHSWLGGLKHKPLTEKDVIILDEAGMVDVRTMEKITAAVETAGARLVCIGDDAQLAAINAGAAFRAVESITGSRALTQVFRQRQEWQKEATEALGSWNVEGAIKAYSENDHITWGDTQNDSLLSLVKDYVASLENTPGSSRLVLGFTHDEVNMLNHAIRSTLKRRGELEGGKVYESASGKIELAPGDQVIFTQNEYDLDIRNGTRAKVAAVTEDGITVILDDGKELTVDFAAYNHIKHAYASTIHSTQGVTVDEAFVFASKGYDANLAYVSLSRFRSDMKIYADRENIPDTRALAGIMSRDRSKDLAHDYMSGSKQQKAYLDVLSYHQSAKECRELMPKMLEWAEGEDAELFEHPDWERFAEARKTRDARAKVIAADLSHHRRFIREAGIYLETLKQHAGITDRILTKEQAAEKAIIKRYAELLKVEPENPEVLGEISQLADSIVRARIGNRALYADWFQEYKIDSTLLHQHSLSLAAKEWQNSGFYASHFAHLEGKKLGEYLSDEETREQLIQLADAVTGKRAEYSALLEKLTYHEARLAGELKEAKRLEGEITDREAYLARAYGNAAIISMLDDAIAIHGLEACVQQVRVGLGGISGFIPKKRYGLSSITNHIEMRESQKRELALIHESIAKTRSLESYAANQQKATALEQALGRFTEEFDYRQLLRAAKEAKARQVEFIEKRSVMAEPELKAAMEKLKNTIEADYHTTEQPFIEASSIYLQTHAEILRIERNALFGKDSPYKTLLDRATKGKTAAETYAIALPWIEGYKRLLAEDTKLKATETADIEKRKAVQALLIGHEAVLRKVFAPYNKLALQQAGADDIATLGLNRKHAYKQYIPGVKASAAPKPAALAPQDESLSPIALEPAIAATKTAEAEIVANPAAALQEIAPQTKIEIRRESAKILLERDIYPKLYSNLTNAFPEFGFRQQGNCYVSTTGYKVDGTVGQKGKVYVYANNPGVFVDYTRAPMSMWEYISKQEGLGKKETFERLSQLAGSGLADNEVRLRKMAGTTIAAPTLIIPSAIEAASNPEMWQDIQRFLANKLQAPEGERVKAYLMHERRYSNDAIIEMGIGFLPMQKALKEYLAGRGYAEEEITAVKLNAHIGRSHQMTLPWHGINGDITGLIARNIDHKAEDEVGKYLYSTGMQRSHMLFGADKLEADRDVIIVEGLLDCLHARVSGAENIVALGGAALNDRQIALLAEKSPSAIVLCLDNDKAGQIGTERAIAKITESLPDMSVKVVTLPEYVKDPDQLIADHGIERLQDAIAEAKLAVNPASTLEPDYRQQLISVLSGADMEAMDAVAAPLAYSQVVTEAPEISSDTSIESLLASCIDAAAQLEALRDEEIRFSYYTGLEKQGNDEKNRLLPELESCSRAGSLLKDEITSLAKKAFKDASAISLEALYAQSDSLERQLYIDKLPLNGGNFLGHATRKKATAAKERLIQALGQLHHHNKRAHFIKNEMGRISRDQVEYQEKLTVITKSPAEREAAIATLEQNISKTLDKLSALELNNDIAQQVKQLEKTVKLAGKEKEVGK